MPFKAKIDRNLCIGSADCVSIAPNTFELDSENKSVVKAQGVDNDDILMQAAKTCPVSAIILTNDSGDQIFP